MKTRTWQWIALVLAVLDIASIAGIIAARRWAMRVETALLDERAAHQQTTGKKTALEALLAVERRLAESDKQQSAKAISEMQRKVEATVADIESERRRAADVAKTIYRPLQTGEEIGPLTVPGRLEPARGPLMNLTMESLTLRTSSGAVSIPLASLPVELRAKAALALVETPPFAPQATPPAPIPPPPPPATGKRDAEPAPDLVAIRQAAQARAESYFRYEYKLDSPGAYTVDVKIVLNDPEKIPGWDNQWRVNGRGYVASVDSAGATFNSGAQRFEAIVESSPKGGSKVREFARR